MTSPPEDVLRHAPSPLSLRAAARAAAAHRLLPGAPHELHELVAAVEQDAWGAPAPEPSP